MAGLYAIQEVLADLVIKLKTSYGEPAAVGLVKFVKTYYFVDCCKLLRKKILPHINRVSLLFQRKGVDLSANRPKFKWCITIEQYHDADVGAEVFIESELSEFGIDVS